MTHSAGDLWPCLLLVPYVVPPLLWALNGFTWTWYWVFAPWLITVVSGLLTVGIWKLFFGPMRPDDLP